jgi:hypothetical protein
LYNSKSQARHARQLNIGIGDPTLIELKGHIAHLIAELEVAKLGRLNSVAQMETLTTAANLETNEEDSSAAALTVQLGLY